jgi:molybdopterin molybdotransferase
MTDPIIKFPRKSKGQDMISPDEALDIVLRSESLLPPKQVPLTEALGCLLAKDVVAPWDCPSFDRAMMDGFAVRLDDRSERSKRIGFLQAGKFWSDPLPEGSCVEIMTGAPCPPSTDVVLPYEMANREGEWVTFRTPPTPGEFIAPRGSECRIGATVLKKGQRLTTLSIAVLASFGRIKVCAHPPPRMAVIVTGREVVRTGKALQPGQIYDANGTMLFSMARDLGVFKIRVVFADDTVEGLTEAVIQQRKTDVILLSGGVSEGLFDLVPKTLRDLGVDILFHKVAQKPGKPLLFGRTGRQLYFGLPGNPLSVHLGFHRYVAPAIRIMQGRSPQPNQGLGLARIGTDGGARTRFLLAHAEKKRDMNDLWTLSVFTNHRSSDIYSVSSANCMICVPPSHAESDDNPREALWEFEWLGKMRWGE